MAAPGNEIDLFAGGVEQTDQRREGWAQNLWKVRQTVSVRPGWGQIAELDTTLGLDIKATTSGARFESTSFGYRRLLGSHYIKASFGNEQIVTLFLARANSGNVFGEPKEFRWDFYLIARIFDLTTNKHWEEVFHRHTSEFALGGELDGSGAILPKIEPSMPSTWHGCYESAYDRDNSSFIAGQDGPEWFFQVYQNTLYFGAPSQGVYMYQPVDFKDLRYQQLNTSEEFDWARGWSESTLIKRLNFTPGIYRDGFVYAEDSALTKIKAASVFRDRLAFATDHEVFFSDPGRVSSIIASNFIQCPSASKITAITEIRGNLLIFTSNETYLYIPSEGTIISRGRPPVNVSNSIGCVGSGAVLVADNRATWVSSTGVYSTSDGQSISEISSDIKSFWKSGGLMTNPMTSYFESALTPDADKGHVDITAIDPPRTLIQFDPKDITLAYNQENKTFLIGCPNLNGAWCYSYGMWSWWPMESVASQSAAGNPEVNTSKNLIKPRVVSSNTDFYAVCGVNQDTMVNSSLIHIDGNASGLIANSLGHNFVLTGLGYGGALDRSCVDEDQRLGSSKYVAVSKGAATGRDHRLYFRPMYGEESASGTTYYCPIELVPPRAAAAWNGNIVAYSFLFKFDNNVWSPNSNAVSGLISARFPTQRLKSSSGFSLIAETNGAGVATPGGGYIAITWVGSGVPAGTYANQPTLNVAKRNSNPLIELPFTPLATTKTMGGLGILMISSQLIDSTAQVITDLPTLAWTGMVVGTDNKHILDSKAQAVDWAYKSRHLSLDGNQMRARGIYARLQSTGPGVTRLIPNWVWGLYNVLLASDNKDYTTQVVDYDDDIQKIVDKLALRSRFRTSSNDKMGLRTFGSAASSPKWGSVATSGHGDYLIDDTQTDTIATSDSIKGETISYMVFGFIRNRASKLTIEGLKGVFRPAGGRRRTGR